ncbi:MAG: glycosyltransferase family 9 protein [Candidatus Goldiibacteriota bacterium]|jgi:heptosyltransferase-2
MNKILVSRTDGIGDLLLTTPLFSELKRAFPRARITALVSAYAAPLLINNPSVDAVIIYDKKEKGLAQKLKKESFDAVFAVYPRPALAWAFFSAGIPLRYGTSSRWYSFLFNKRVKLSRKSSEKHEADYNLAVAGEFTEGARAQKEYFFITEVESRKAVELMEKKGIKKGFIALHPGSKGSAWNLSAVKYTRLAAMTAGAGYCVLLTGSGAEKGDIKVIAQNAGAKSGIFVLDEELSLRDFAAVLSLAGLVISCSTGPMHIAAALGIKTLSFFPPDNIRAMRPKRWGPLGNDHVIIQPPEGNEKEAAMDLIDIKGVMEKIKDMAVK